MTSCPVCGGTSGTVLADCVVLDGDIFFLMDDGRVHLHGAFIRRCTPQDVAAAFAGVRPRVDEGIDL